MILGTIEIIVRTKSFDDFEEIFKNIKKLKEDNPESIIKVSIDFENAYYVVKDF